MRVDTSIPRATSQPVRAEAAGETLRHPVIVAMLVLWFINDHFLKEAFANELTGKLSDVAGLAVFPLVPLVAYEVLCALRLKAPRHRNGVLLGAMIATGLVMVGINIWDSWADAYRIGLAALQWPWIAFVDVLSGGQVRDLQPVFLTMDPTDAFTLPALLIPWWVAR